MNDIPMQIGLDIHGVIDKFPEQFRELSKMWDEQGHRIHIVTGQEWDIALPQVHEAGIVFHEHYSIVDRHQLLSTEMYERTDKEGWWMNDMDWNSSKGNYAMANGLDIHFDDSFIYGEYFPLFTTYVRVPQKGFDEILEKMFLT